MKCPGQDTQYWKTDAIYDAPCPQCGKTVEFFKDDSARKCEHCGHRFPNPRMDFGCAAYCKYAAQCIGDLKPELMAQRENLLKDRVAVAMKRHFRTDFKRIGRATRVARHAERIARQEGGDLAVILSAAYLHDIGGGEGARGDEGAGAIHQTQSESALLAGRILTDLGAAQPLITEVCDIIARRRNPEASESLNFRVVYDAERIEALAGLKAELPADPAKRDRTALTGFLTESGRAEARAALIPE